MTAVATGYLISWHLHFGVDFPSAGSAKAECIAIVEVPYLVPSIWVENTSISLSLGVWMGPCVCGTRTCRAM